MKSLSYIPAGDGSGDASLMTVTQVRTAPATSITVNTVAGVPSKFFGTMGTPHTFSDPVTGETITIISEATAVNFAGHVDSGKIEIDAIANGETDLGSKVGDIIIIRPTTQWADNLYNVLSESLDDDGTLKDESVTLSKINGGTTAGLLTTDTNGTVTPVESYQHHAAITSNFVTSSTTAVAVTNLQIILTVPAGGATYILDFSSISVGNNTTAYSTVEIWDGGVISGTKLTDFSTYSGNTPPMYYKKRVTLAAGAHTIRTSLRCSAGTSTISATVISPASISLTRVI